MFTTIEDNYKNWRAEKGLDDAPEEEEEKAADPNDPQGKYMTCDGSI